MLEISPVPAYTIPAVTEVPEIPVPPYRQTPAPVMVSQMHIRRLVSDRWEAEIKRYEAEIKRCEEARKVHLLEVQLAAHGITRILV
jgi:hypothetical protein